MFNAPDKVLPQPGETVTLRFAASDLLLIRD
jgi:putative spermidine/putrescine transport system ATP-binding protein